MESSPTPNLYKSAPRNQFSERGVAFRPIKQKNACTKQTLWNSETIIANWNKETYAISI